MYLGIWYSQSRSRDSRGRRPGGIKLLGRGCQRLCMYEWGVETGDFILRNLGAMTFSSNWVTFQADSGVSFFFFLAVLHSILFLFPKTCSCECLYWIIC